MLIRSAAAEPLIGILQQSRFEDLIPWISPFQYLITISNKNHTWSLILADICLSLSTISNPSWNLILADACLLSRVIAVSGFHRESSPSMCMAYAPFAYSLE